MISSTAIFAASDIRATLAFYKDVLGFESSWTWGEPPSFGSVTLGGVTIMFNLQPDLAAVIQGHQHWVKVDDVDSLYKLHRDRGAKIVTEIGDKPWGVREYVVEDLNGYHLRFAGALSSEAPASKPFPEGVTLERRVPTSDEYASVAGLAFGYKEPVAEVLEKTWKGVVAISPDGEAIGMVRIMWDAPGWFSVWDVAVTPSWQANRIGSTMMRDALEMVREVSPTAIVHLFTYKHGFYERIGFNKETVSMLRL